MIIGTAGGAPTVDALIEVAGPRETFRIVLADAAAEVFRVTNRLVRLLTTRIVRIGCAFTAATFDALVAVAGPADTLGIDATRPAGRRIAVADR